MTFVIATAIMVIQVKHDNNMLSLCKVIERFLLLKDFFSATFFPNLDAAAKVLLYTNIFPKALTKRWNQANLGYFNPYLDKAYGEGKIVLIDKNVYYKNIILFVQYLQSLITF